MSSEYSSKILLFLLHQKKKIHIGLEQMMTYFFFFIFYYFDYCFNSPELWKINLWAATLASTRYICVCRLSKNTSGFLSLSSVFPHSPFTIWATVWCCYPQGDGEHAEDFSSFYHPFHCCFPPPVWRERMDYRTSQAHGSVTFALSPPSTHTYCTSFRV